MNFEKLHDQALKISRQLRYVEFDLLCILQQIDTAAGYSAKGYTSLSAYVTGALGFSQAQAYHYVTVARKAVRVPELQAALKRDEITISKAKTIAPVITRENAARWIELAAKCTVRELEREVAQENPEIMRIEKVRHRAKDQVDMSVTVREVTMELVKRAQELLSQSKDANVSLAEALHELAKFYVERKDPLRKAERKAPAARTEREKALLRDRGTCQFRLPEGKICGSRYWLDLHHVKPRAQGGSDEAANLITLCSAHHRMVHAPPAT